MTREPMPGGLDTVPDGVVEGFLQQECQRYREALIAIEALGPDGNAGAHHRVAVLALDAGDEAAG